MNAREVIDRFRMYSIAWAAIRVTFWVPYYLISGPMISARLGNVGVQDRNQRDDCPIYAQSVIQALSIGAQCI